jgi:hypothetical protein
MTVFRYPSDGVSDIWSIYLCNVKEGADCFAVQIKKICFFPSPLETTDGNLDVGLTIWRIEHSATAAKPHLHHLFPKIEMWKT